MSFGKYSALSLLMVFFTLVRYVAHIYYDNTIFYDGIVFGWSFVVLSIWIIITIVKVLNLNPSFVKKVVNSRPWRLFDLMTYPLYLTHYMFSSGDISVVYWVDGLIFQLLVFSFVTVVFASIVLLISEHSVLKRILCNQKLYEA